MVHAWPTYGAVSAGERGMNRNRAAAGSGAGVAGGAAARQTGMRFRTPSTSSFSLILAVLHPSDVDMTNGVHVEIGYNDGDDFFFEEPSTPIPI